MKYLKPYDLVDVTMPDEFAEGGKRMFVGQVMSFPTPENTIMVRTIPGHPGTLVELPVTDLAIPNRKYRYVHYAIIKGNGNFPVDMLRYDSCVPVNFTLEPKYGGQKAVFVEGCEAQDQLMVADVSDKAQPSWTVARWSSFLWGCRHFKTERIS